MSDPASAYTAIQQAVGRVIVGNEPIVRRITISLLTGGHVLLEGVPGVGKTTIANLFARATGLTFGRVQMTPDILPADITGTHVYREPTGEFELHRGPVFANVVLADEVNRATPKTQSALLEAMQESHVTIGGETLPLPDPFLVIATQNPLEHEGTYELPVAQRDRFQFKLTIDLPDAETEGTMLDRFDSRPALGPADVEAVLSGEALAEARRAVADTYVDDRVKSYILDVVGRTRTTPDVAHGASPRASLAFLATSKALATLRGRDYVIPDDVKALAPGILAHRLVLSTEATLADVTTASVVEDVLAAVDPPGSGGAAFAAGESADGDG